MDLSQHETARLRLNRPAESDFGDYLRLFSNPAVMATLGGVHTPEKSREWFDRMMGHWPAFGFGLWTIRDKTIGTFVGRGGLRLVILEGTPEAEVGYTLLAEYWGRGLATELARESLRVGFEVIGLHDIVSFTLPTNIASRRVMEKAGLTYEREGLYVGMPHVIYRITRQSWVRDPR